MTDPKLPPITRDAPPMPACQPPKEDAIMTLQAVMLQLAEDVRRQCAQYVIDVEGIDYGILDIDLAPIVAAHLPPELTDEQIKQMAIDAGLVDRCGFASAPEALTTPYEGDEDLTPEVLRFGRALLAAVK